MLVVPKSEITLGSVRFYGQNTGINAVSITQSVENIGTTASLTIPRNFRRKDGQGILDCIKVGDKATIRLGYNDHIETEFIGYISSISDTTPIVIELEDEWYQLKKQHITRSWQRPTLNQVLQAVFTGWTIDNRVDCSLDGGFIIQNTTPYEIAKSLKESYGFTIYLNPDTKTVLAFFPYQFEGFNTHTYVFGTRDCTKLDDLRQKQLAPNIVKNNLKFTRKEDNKLFITAKYTDRKGKNHKIEIGERSADANRRTLNLGCNIQSEQEALQLAGNEINRLSFDGYTGKLTGFGLPRTCAGDAVKLIDPDNPEREGTYLIKAVKITYAVNKGFRRECELSYKIN